MARQKRGFVAQEGDTPDKWSLESEPEPIFEANEGIPQSRIVDVGTRVLQNQGEFAKVDAKIEKTEVMTFRRYSAMIGKSPSDYPQVSPERLVWVIQIYYPQGYDHPRVGVIENARAVSIYDAETGKFFSQSFTRLE